MPVRPIKTLLVYYHPVVWDLAETFSKMNHSVTVAVNPKITDNYGTGFDIIKRAQKKFDCNIDVIPLPLALAHLNQKKYDLVGCDGVFDGDKMVMEVCGNNNIPHFCIQGYPNVVDEPSNNVLSLGWFMPTIRYHKRFPSEGHKKQIDWKEIAEKGRSSTKNFCVFYPTFHKFKQKIRETDFRPKEHRSGFVSLIQGYQKWNAYSYEVFKQVAEKVKGVENLQGKSHKECFERINKAKALLHLKWADQPGIAIFEAMLLGRPVITMNSFVLASMNAEVLIPDYNSLIADSVDELLEYMQSDYDDYYVALGENAEKHAMMLTNFGRQKFKLTRFVNRCLND